MKQPLLTQRFFLFVDPKGYIAPPSLGLGFDVKRSQEVSREGLRGHTLRVGLSQNASVADVRLKHNGQDRTSRVEVLVMGRQCVERLAQGCSREESDFGGYVYVGVLSMRIISAECAKVYLSI